MEHSITLFIIFHTVINSLYSSELGFCIEHFLYPSIVPKDTSQWIWNCLLSPRIWMHIRPSVWTQGKPCNNVTSRVTQNVSRSISDIVDLMRPSKEIITSISRTALYTSQNYNIALQTGSNMHVNWADSISTKRFYNAGQPKSKGWSNSVHLGGAQGYRPPGIH